MTGDFGPDALLVGRVWDPEAGGPCVVAVRDGALFDITSRDAPTVRDLLERDDAADYATAAPGRALGPLATVAAASRDGGDGPRCSRPATCRR